MHIVLSDDFPQHFVDHSLGRYVWWPFQHAEYIRIFDKHFPLPNKQSFALSLMQEDTLLVTGIFDVMDRSMRFSGTRPVVGGNTVTDYADLIALSPNETGTYITLLHEYVRTHLPEVEKISFENIREDSHLNEVLVGKGYSSIQIDVAPYVSLPPTWDAYLEKLERTDRKELKRKFRRLEEVPHQFFVGEPNAQNMAKFFQQHRLSDTAKDLFMSPPMEAFFSELVSGQFGTWAVRVAQLTIQNNDAASVLFFEDRDSVLLYNSGFDPEHKYYSTGLLLKAWLIKYAIEHQKKTYDFLRGGERYKYDLGGQDLKLFNFSVSLR